MNQPTRVILTAIALAAAPITGCATADRPERSSTSGGVKREQIEWCDIWVTNADRENLPRVLLIGDSITRGYFAGVETRLAGKANCARVTTSKSIGDPGLLPEVELLLDQYRFAVIHVNNGLHGWSYSEEEYAEAFGPFMRAIMSKSRGAKVIWTQTTPVVVNGSTSNERSERVAKRNAIAAAFATEHQLAVDDLYGLVVGHVDWYSPDGVHFNKQGIEAQAEQVAAGILRAME